MAQARHSRSPCIQLRHNDTEAHDVGYQHNGQDEQCALPPLLRFALRHVAAEHARQLLQTLCPPAAKQTQLVKSLKQPEPGPGAVGSRVEQLHAVGLHC